MSQYLSPVWTHASVIFILKLIRTNQQLCTKFTKLYLHWHYPYMFQWTCHDLQGLQSVTGTKAPRSVKSSYMHHASMHGTQHTKFILKSERLIHCFGKLTTRYKPTKKLNRDRKVGRNTWKRKKPTGRMYGNIKLKHKRNKHLHSAKHHITSNNQNVVCAHTNKTTKTVQHRHMCRINRKLKTKYNWGNGQIRGNCKLTPQRMRQITPYNTIKRTP
jgi:hypothetical protein